MNSATLVPLQVSSNVVDAIKNQVIWEAPHPSRHELIVFVHGYARGPKDYQGLLKELRKGSGGESSRTDIYAFPYDSSPFCTQSPEVIAGELRHEISLRAAHYETLHIVGHSMGCLILREAILGVLTASQDAVAKADPFAEKLRSAAVRLTLLASTNRGFRPTKVWHWIAIEFFHRWFWMVLLCVAWGGWCQAFVTFTHATSRASHSSPLQSAIYAIANLPLIDFLPMGVALIVFIVAFWQFLVHRMLSLPLILLLSVPVIWAVWAAINPDPIPGASRSIQEVVSSFSAIAIVGTGAIVGFMGRGLGFKRNTFLFQGIFAALIALGVAWMPHTLIWIWPSTLLLLLPAILYPFSTGLLAEHILYGSAWITSVRLRWLETFFNSQIEPEIVHVFGMEDDLVSEDDHKELSHNKKLWQVALPEVKHVYFQMTARAKFRARDEANHAKVAHAIDAVAASDWKSLVEQLREQSVMTPDVQTPSQTSHSTPPVAELVLKAVPTPSKPAIVFLIHGIRDYAEWQEAMTAKIREVAKDENVELCDVVSVRYGYFSAFQFLFSGERHRATHTFLDLYAQVKARYPNSDCHVVAHSNGTYVVGAALHDNSFIKLTNLYLCGSVLSRDFPWPDVYGNEPKGGHGCIVGNVHSDRAAWDWPVGVLCWILSWISSIPRIGNLTPYRYLGSGGVDGFTRKRLMDQQHDFLTERYYLNGEHGEALRQPYHAEIARFLLKNRELQPRPGALAKVSWLWFFGLRALVLGICCLVGLLYLFTIALAPPGDGTWAVLTTALLTLFIIRAVMAV